MTNHTMPPPPDSDADRAPIAAAPVGRPRTHHEQRVTTVRLPQSLHARLKAVAEERQIAQNLIMVRAIEVYLDALPPIDRTLLP